MVKGEHLRESRCILIANRSTIEEIERTGIIKPVNVNDLLKVMRWNYDSEYPSVDQNDIDAVQKLFQDLYSYYDQWLIDNAETARLKNESRNNIG